MNEDLNKAGKAILVAKVKDASFDNWWSKFYGVSFLVLAIRQNTVLVKSCIDEGYSSPYNVHEFPNTAVDLIYSKPFLHPLHNQ